MSSNTQPEVQVAQAHYLTEKYLSMERFINYHRQVQLIRELQPKTVLMIGVGDLVVPSLLRQIGIKVTTVDFDASLSPDIVSDVRALSASIGQYDMICAFQTLEHIPYEDFEKVLFSFSKIAKQHVIISVPHRRSGFEFIFKFPFIRSLLKRDFVRCSLLFPVRFGGFESSGQHYWEIDHYTTSLRTVRNSMSKHFAILKEHTPPLDHYRRFFVLSTKKKQS